MAGSAAPRRQGQPLDGGSGGGQGYWLGAPGFAWEFLRRNPDYRSDYAQWARRRSQPGAPIDKRWGLRFAADPLLPAERAAVFWRPDVAPGLVLPMEVRGDAGGLPGPRRLPPATAVTAEDGVHLRTDGGLQMIVRGQARVDEPLVVVLAFDDHFGLRVRAVAALARLASGLPPPKSSLTDAQRSRLSRCLSALDGSQAGLSYRQIAQQLFGPRAVHDEAWRTASVRGATIRLVNAGRELMAGGYLRLLKRGL